jgi:hypothetical protein
MPADGIGLGQLFSAPTRPAVQQQIDSTPPFGVDNVVVTGPPRW